MMNLSNTERLISNSLQSAPSSSSAPFTPSTGLTKFGSFITSPALHVALLIALVLVTFGRTITSYFLADDFGHIGYIYAMCNGHWNMFWANFTGSFMQIPGITVYRPSQLLCELLDWFLYKADARGWYCSNLLYFSACSVALYMVCRRLLESLGPNRAALAAFSTAALFALNPLRCESVSWMVGRVDIVACLFYLMSFWLFLQPRTKINTAASIVAFSIGITVKEMPVGLPVVLTGHSFLFALGQSQHTNRLDRFFVAAKTALIKCAPWWSTLAVYFCIRRLCLGTFAGGYAAGIGGGSIVSAMHKWVDPDTLHRLFFPFNQAVAPEPNVYSTILLSCYWCLAALFAVRLVLGSMPWKLVAFIALWAFTCAVPIYQLWGIGYELEGGRFYYFLSIPIMLMLSVLAFAPVARPVTATTLDSSSPGMLEPAGTKPDSLAQLRSTVRRFEIGCTAFGVVAVVAIGLVLGHVTAMTNTAWVNAGKEIKRLQTACLQLAASYPSSRFVILNVPSQHAGAHQILNGTTFETLFIPPFNKEKLANKFVNFEPVMFGAEGCVNATRFRKCLNAGIPVYVWNSERGALSAVPFDSNTNTSAPCASSEAMEFFSKSGDSSPALTAARKERSFSLLTLGHAKFDQVGSAVVIRDCLPDDALRLAGPAINTSRVDFLEFDAKFKGGAADRNVLVRWSPAGKSASEKLDESNQAAARVDTTNSGDSEFVHVTVDLSHHWRWFVAGSVNELLLFPGPAERVELRNVKLLKKSSVCPLLQVVAPVENASGIVELARSKAELQLDVTPAAVSNNRPITLEVGTTNQFFENEQSADSVARHCLVPVKAGEVRLKLVGSRFKALFPLPGYYQLRAKQSDASISGINRYSDTLTVHLVR